jgi:hypothetical protein
MSQPTPQQVTTEIARLRELRDKVPARTFFGDSNVAAIDAQIEVLTSKWSENAIYDRWDDDERLLEVALEARHWLDRDVEPPSDGWAHLVKP